MGKRPYSCGDHAGSRPQAASGADGVIADGINAVRRTLPLCVFHPRTEETGIAALEQYRREWDDEKKAFRATHVHDWTSHPADAFRYLALAWRLMPRQPVETKIEPGAWMVPPPPEVRLSGDAAVNWERLNNRNTLILAGVFLLFVVAVILLLAY